MLHGKGGNQLTLTRVLKCGRERWQSQYQSDATWETQDRQVFVDFEGGGRSHSQECGQPLEFEKGQENGFSLEPSEGNAALMTP